MSSANEFEVTIPNDLKYMTVLENLLQDLMDLGGYPQEERDNTWLAFHEAVVNAIVHGNQNDPEKKVKVTMAINPESVRLSIEDQGSGFELEQVKNCTIDCNRLEVSGRGIFLMQHYMDEVAIKTTPGGPTQVILTYSRKSPVSL